MNFTRPKRILVSAAALAVLTGLSACGSSDNTSGASVPQTSPAQSQSSEQTPSTPRSSAPAEDPAEDAVVEIKDFAYSGPESVAPGATVTVVNQDRSTHSFTIAEEGIEVVLSGDGKSGTITAPSKPGDYTVTCKFHPEMSGTLVVA